MPLHPSDRPAPQFVPLVEALAEHDVHWVMCGSQVLALHGGDIAPNDLDIVPDLNAENLGRLASCLDALDAIRACFGGAGGAGDTVEACLAWRTDPATPENLDHLLVTRLGMLDIVIKNADPYATLLEGASRMWAGGTPILVCDPRRVLKSLEKRDRRKDRPRRPVYEAMRRSLGLPGPDV